MVLKPRSELLEVWGWIKDAAAANIDAQTALLLVGHDVDAIAATSIFTKLLEDEPVTYKIVPLKDYRDLSRIYTEQIVHSPNLRSIIMLNCGGVIDLMGTLQAALDDEGGAPRVAEQLPHPDCRWYVIDSHRPHSLENVVEDDGKVFLVHADADNPDLDELREQVDILAAPDGAEDVSDEEEEPPTQRRRMSVDEYNALSPDSRADQRAQLRRLSRRYYSASWHGSAAALLLYSLVQALNKASNELLWHAIVGLTDQLVHERVEYERYVLEAQTLQAEVAGLNQGGVEEEVVVGDAETDTAVRVRQHLSTSMRLDSVQAITRPRPPPPPPPRPRPPTLPTSRPIPTYPIPSIGSTLCRSSGSLSCATGTCTTPSTTRRTLRRGSACTSSRVAPSSTSGWRAWACRSTSASKTTRTCARPSRTSCTRRCCSTAPSSASST